VMQKMRAEVMTDLLDRGERLDGREFDEYRPIKIQKNPITTADGSAYVRIGNTQVLAAVKFEVVAPFPDRPKEGALIMNAEHLPVANPSFEAGPPDEKSIEMARTVDRAIRSSEAIDLNELFIEDGKVLGIFVDLYVLDHAGNYTDAATLAATAALLNTKMPKIEGGVIIRGEYKDYLKLRALPLSTTFIRVGRHWLVDPTEYEEKVLNTRLTIATTEEHVCAMQKAEGWVTKDELLERIDVAFKKGSELRKLLTI
ncbi:MAG: exosome complex protein Rrp42, partial [Candidatus Bilamarchaeaceae archaeon]